MRRMKVKELVAEAFASVAELPPKHALLMREVATRLDATFAALKEWCNWNRNVKVKRHDCI